MLGIRTPLAPDKFIRLLTVLGFSFLLCGCAGFLPKSPEEQFVARIDAFTAEILSRSSSAADSMAPAAVMSASLIHGGEYTRLEEYVVDRLATELRRYREIYAPTRENWFELRERQSLTFAGLPDTRRSYLDNLVVYQIGVSSDPVLKTVTVRATAVDARGKPVPGIMSEIRFSAVDAASPALLQYRAEPQVNPMPEGLEERPFASMDRLAYSLASELTSAYRAHFDGNPEAPADSEVKVVLQTRSVNGTAGGGFLRRLESALQQALVARKGFTCAVSRKDFGPAFDQIDFYRDNREIFEMDETLLSPGSVVLLAEIFPHRDSGAIGINLRSLWRIMPLENQDNRLIARNLGGTYISGFVAKAYLQADRQDLLGQGTGQGERTRAGSRRSAPAGSGGFE